MLLHVEGKRVNGTFITDEEVNLVDCNERELLLEVKPTGDTHPNDVLKHVLDKAGHIVKPWLVERFGEDVLEMEGGIDQWWGLGSVAMFELGINFGFIYDSSAIGVAIAV